MNPNKRLGIALWLIGLVVMHLLALLLPEELTAGRWATYGFALFAFFSQLLLWLWIWRAELPPGQQFLRLPLLTVSAVYLTGQVLLCLLFALLSASVKTAVLVNALFLCATWAMELFAAVGGHHVQETDSRQKDHHKAL